MAAGWVGLFAAVCQARQVPYPQPPTKKGLQVQMVDDALALGIHHAALNVNLASLIEPIAAEESLTFDLDGRTFAFNAHAVASLDRQIEPLSAAGVVVSLILLVYEPADPQRRRILLHPQYSPACPNHLSCFNVRTEEGRAWLRAAVEFMADRWSPARGERGVVWNWILGNEVNSHGFWCNRGDAKMAAFAEDYLQALRIAVPAVARHNAEGRVFVSLEHHWNIAYPGGTAGQCFPARPFLEYLARATRDDPDLGWHVAFHPYPENLFEPRSWLDRTATDDWRTTERITFRNIDQLPKFLQQPELAWRGQPRRVILSEQGFHTPEGADGETIQAAAFCYAWKRVDAIEGIDAFILHRHVDHAHEGGLRLGLWTRQAESVADPERRKAIYRVFQAAGTAEEAAAFEFARPILGEDSFERPPRP